MISLYRVIEQMRIRPEAFLRVRSVAAFDVWLDGYSLALRSAGIVDPERVDFDGFVEWLIVKHKIPRSPKAWYIGLQSFSGGDAAALDFLLSELAVYLSRKK